MDSAQFSVVVAQPTLSIVDPGSGMQGAQNITVNILGQFTAFDSTTTFSFGPNIVVNGAPTILGPTIATQSISIPQLAPLGGNQVVATTSDVTGSAAVVGGAYFSVTPSLALISAISPNTAAQGTALTVDIQGQNTHWNASTTFSLGAGIVVTSTVVNSETDATLTLAIPALASEGPTGATAQTAGEIARISNGFVVTAGTPLPALRAARVRFRNRAASSSPSSARPPPGTRPRRPPFPTVRELCSPTSTSPDQRP